MDSPTKPAAAAAVATPAAATSAAGGGLTPFLCFCTFVSVIGSSFLYGYNVGDLNTPATVINETFYMSVYSARASAVDSSASANYSFIVPPINVGPTTVLLWQLTVALFVAGGAVGSLGQFHLRGLGICQIYDIALV